MNIIFFHHIHKHTHTPTHTHTHIQAGRAGRAGKDSIAILVCFDTPVDHFFATHPDELLERKPEMCVCDATNTHALRGQILSAADENLVGGRHYPGNLDRALFGADAFDEAISQLLQVCTHTHTHTHTYTSTHRYTHSDGYISMKTHTPPHLHTQIYIHIHKHPHI
jgi:hypothetical protein